MGRQIPDQCTWVDLFRLGYLMITTPGQRGEGSSCSGDFSISQVICLLLVPCKHMAALNGRDLGPVLLSHARLE